MPWQELGFCGTAGFAFYMLEGFPAVTMDEVGVSAFVGLETAVVDEFTDAFGGKAKFFGGFADSDVLLHKPILEETVRKK